MEEGKQAFSRAASCLFSTCRSRRAALLPTSISLTHSPTLKMPKIRTSRTAPPPEGFEDIEDILQDYDRAMRDAEAEDNEGKRKAESLWGIMRIAHTRSRYIYELYYKREAISQELYDWLLKQGYADAG